MNLKFRFSLLVVAIMLLTACENSAVNNDDCTTQNILGELSTQELQVSGVWENARPDGIHYMVSKLSLNEDRTGQFTWEAFKFGDLKNRLSKINVPICSWQIKQDTGRDTLLTSFGKVSGEAYSPDYDQYLLTIINRDSYNDITQFVRVTNPNSMMLGPYKWNRVSKK